ADGQTFERTTSGHRSGFWPATVVTAGSGDVRYVRVTPGVRGQLNPSEISVWPPEPPPALATAPPAGGVDLPVAPSKPGSPSRTHHRAARLFGIVLLIAVAAGLAGF